MDPQVIKTLITCPLTKQIYHTPVSAPDGEIYELEALEHWCSQRGGKSPTTLKRMKQTFYPVTELEPVIQDYLEQFPEARQYVPGHPELSAPTESSKKVKPSKIDPQVIKQWVLEGQIEELKKYLEQGNPNLILRDEHHKKVSLLRLALRIGYVELVQLLLNHPDLKYKKAINHKQGLYYPWLSSKYQGTLEKQHQLLKLFKKNKLLKKDGLNNIFPFLSLEIIPEFVRQTKTILKEGGWEEYQILQCNTHYPHWKTVVQTMIQHQVWPYLSFMEHLVADSEMIEYLLQFPLTNDDLDSICRDSIKYPSSLELILNSGADINRSFDNHFTAFQAACLWSAKAVEMMMHYGPKINHQSNDGHTPLHLASIQLTADSALFLVQLLLDQGADPRILNDDQETPRHLVSARYPERIELIELLRKAEEEAEKKVQKEPVPHL